jgi:hypothetical protein
MSSKRSKFASSLICLFVELRLELSSARRIKAIRQVMLDSLFALGESRQAAQVIGKVLLASDIQTLWYLRSDVMTLLCSRLGESAAQTQISIVTAMFKGLLPAAQKSRPNRLSR